MRKLLIFTTWCIFFHSEILVMSQPLYFNKRYDFFQEPEVAWNVLELDSGYIIEGGVYDNLGYPGIGILFLDKNGNPVWRKSWGRTGFAYFSGTSGGMIKTIEDNFALGGSMTDSTGNSDGMLLLFKNNGDTLWSSFYGSPYFDVFYYCKQTPDSGFVLIGATDESSSGGNTDIWLVKTNKDGNLQWEKTYGGGGVEYGWTIDLCFDGGYIIGGFTDSYGLGDFDAYIIKTDNAGNEQWSKTFGSSYFDSFGCVKQALDSGFIIGYGLAKYTMSSYYQSQINIIKLKSSGEIIWDKKFGPARWGTEVYALHELSDGSIVAGGQGANRSGTPEGNGWLEGRILKVSSQGDSVWYRVIQYDSCEKNFDYVRDMKPTSDRGFIVAGFFDPENGYPCYNTGTQDMWVVKLDSMGCPYPGCDTVQGVIYLQPYIKNIARYPNPASNILHISGLPKNKNIEVSVYDIPGKLMKRMSIPPGQNNFEFNCTGFDRGIYFLKITANNEIISNQKIMMNK